jgi:hypothetical protein
MRRSIHWRSGIRALGLVQARFQSFDLAPHLQHISRRSSRNCASCRSAAATECIRETVPSNAVVQNRAEREDRRRMSSVPKEKMTTS